MPNPLEPMNEYFFLGILLAGLLAILSYRARFLNGSGAGGTFVTGSIIFGIGKLKWSIPILTFFILSSIISKFGGKRKSWLIDIFEKSGRRDIVQVFANGGIPTALLLLHFSFPNPTWFLLYLGALAASTADTWGTELGTLFNHRSRLITNFKKVPIGTSGGITLIGTAGALFGALVLAATGFIPGVVNDVFHTREFIIVVFAGLIGSGIDSLLGATVQAKYECVECQRVTEKKNHCSGMKTKRTAGIKMINNDVVNLLCSLSGAVLVYVGFRLW